MQLEEGICYQVASGAVESRLGRHTFLSTPQGGKILVDQRVIDIWRQADNQTLKQMIETILEEQYSETELRAAVACLCQAGLLERLPDMLTDESILTPQAGPLVSVIIVSYNSQSWLEECLDSLAKQTYQPLEIILVDNHSNDNTVAWITANHPEIQVIQLSITVSLAQAINAGVEVARGTYFLILNPDLRLELNAVAELVQAALSEPNAAALAAKLKLYWTPGFLNGMGNLVGAFGFGWDIGLGYLDLGQFDGHRELPSACFAAALIPRSAWQIVGPLDPGFPLYYEDSEWCYRARLLGLKIYAAPKAVVNHAFGSRTPDKPAPGISTIRLHRVVYGRLRFANKLLSDPYRRQFTRRYRGEDFLRLLMAFVRLNSSQVSAIREGWKKFRQASDLPILRANLQRQRKIDDETLFEVQKAYPSPLIWRGSPVLTWDIIQSVYLPQIQVRKTIPLPEFPDSFLIQLPAVNKLQRWNEIRRFEGIPLLFHRLFRTIQRRLAQP